MTVLPRVLLVDDEQALIDGVTLHLRRRFDVHSATSGPQALEVVARDGPFAVLLSDMRMPGMDGATLLSRVRETAPDTVRMLLTGYTDMNAAIKAVNEGNIFRFLTKPCPPDQLVAAMLAGAEQHRLVTAERVLLEQTLRGAVKMLADVLALASPVGFGRAARMKDHALRTAAWLKLTDAWTIEVAALLSQVGCITLPPATAERHYLGRPLSVDEQRQVAHVPRVAAELLEKLPRMEAVRAALEGMEQSLQDPAGPPCLGARILKVALDYDVLEARGLDAATVAATLRDRHGLYDPKVLDAFLDSGGARAAERVLEVRLVELRPGMALVEDIRGPSGVLLVARGHEVTPGLVDRLVGYGVPAGQQVRVVTRLAG
ncbi:MAG: response regulator [Deltaproteobacteria bacterium]|nr:response regulator [Deltaproteobacteria bacterium]